MAKLYLDEPDRDPCLERFASDAIWTTARLTSVEVRGLISRALKGNALAGARRKFAEDWSRTQILELDRRTCEAAAEIAERWRTRALDSLHLGAATRAGLPDLRFLTYDRRQAEAARAIGFDVIGV